MPGSPSVSAPPPDARLRAARILLVALAVPVVYVGVWALFAPASFYESFPGGGRAWVSALPAFNEHLVRDVGAFYLVIATLYVWAAALADRRMITAVSLASLVFAVPHLIFHAFNLEGLEGIDQAAQMSSLALSVAGPLAAALLARAPRST